MDKAKKTRRDPKRREIIGSATVMRNFSLII